MQFESGLVIGQILFPEQELPDIVLQEFPEAIFILYVHKVGANTRSNIIRVPKHRRVPLVRPDGLKGHLELNDIYKDGAEGRRDPAALLEPEGRVLGIALGQTFIVPVKDADVGELLEKELVAIGLIILLVWVLILVLLLLVILVVVLLILQFLLADAPILDEFIILLKIIVLLPAKIH